MTVIARRRSAAPVAFAVLMLLLCSFALSSDLGAIPFGQLWEARWTLVAVTGLSLLNYALRAERWHRYIRKLGLTLPRSESALIFIAGFAYTLLPGKVGELIRGYYYRPMGLPLSKTASAFVVERLCDLLTLLILCLLGLGSLIGGGTFVIWGVGLGGALAVLGVVFGISSRRVSRPLGRLSERLLATRLSPHLWARCRAAGGAIADARSLLGWRAMVGGVLLGLVAWGAEGVGLYLVTDIAASPATLGMAEATGIYAIAIVAGALSFLPGWLGTTEAAMSGLLLTQGFNWSDAVLIALVCRLLTLWLAVVLGWISVLVLRARYGRQAPAREGAKP